MSDQYSLGTGCNYFVQWNVTGAFWLEVGGSLRDHHEIGVKIRWQSSHIAHQQARELLALLLARDLEVKLRRQVLRQAILDAVVLAAESGKGAKLHANGDKVTALEECAWYLDQHTSRKHGELVSPTAVSDRGPQLTGLGLFGEEYCRAVCQLDRSFFKSSKCVRGGQWHHWMPWRF